MQTHSIVRTGSSISEDLARDDPDRLLAQERHARGHDTDIQTHSPIMRQIATYAGLVPMAFFGVLIRLGFEALGDCELTDNLTYIAHPRTSRRRQNGVPSTMGAGGWLCHYGDIAVSEKRDSRIVRVPYRMTGPLLTCILVTVILRFIPR